MTFARLLTAAATAAATAVIVPGILTSTGSSPEIAATSTLTEPRGGRNLKVVRLIDTRGHRVGYAAFARVNRDDLTVTLQVERGIAPGFHGLHVHANDDPGNGSGCNRDAGSEFTAVDGHYKAPGQVHGQHDGDLPSLLVGEDGNGYLSTKTQPGLEFSDLSGLAIILHSGSDNYNNVPVGEEPGEYTANSQAAVDATANTGNAGSRVACGVIR